MLPCGVVEVDAGPFAGRHERDWEIAIDVRIHPGECELDRCDAALGSRLDQRRPCLRRATGIMCRPSKGIKEQIRERDVKLSEERRISKFPGHDRLPDCLRNREVELGEPADAVRRWERTFDRA